MGTSDGCLHGVDTSDGCLHGVDTSDGCLHGVDTSDGCLYDVDTSDGCLHGVGTSDVYMVHYLRERKKKMKKDQTIFRNTLENVLLFVLQYFKLLYKTCFKQQGYFL